MTNPTANPASGGDRDRFLHDIGNRPQDTWTPQEISQLFLFAAGCDNLRAAAPTPGSAERTPTPLTDSALLPTLFNMQTGEPTSIVRADFARDLEHQLAAAVGENKDKAAQIDYLHDCLRAAQESK